MKYLFFIFTIVISFGLFSPILAQQTTTTTTSTSTTDPVWTCDQLKSQINEYGSGRAGALPNTICKLSDVYSKFVNIFYYFIGIIGVLMIIYGGFMYMTSRDNEAQKKQGKDILLYTILGLVIALLAAWIVGLIIKAVVDNQIF